VNSDTPESQPPEEKQRVPRRAVKHWRLIAAACSAIVPGVGQWLLGQRTRAVFYWILLVGVVSLWWPLRLPMTFWGLLLAAAATEGLWIVSAVEALFDVRRSPSRPRLAWLLIVAPAAYFVPALLVGHFLMPVISGFRLYEIPSSGMEPTINENEYIIADMRDVEAHADAPVIFERDSTRFIKRVIGMPGNVVQGKDANIFVNGAELNEPYVQHTGVVEMPNLNNFESISVPQGQVFVLGDNRDFSLDSRMPDFGTVPIAEIKGKPLYIFASKSLTRMGKKIH
jgi:signal peptidase I